ncbi:MAG: ribonuclease Y [Clostridia bacterium]|nr:ribonuclease Y [Clostridia bacterium]
MPTVGWVGIIAAAVVVSAVVAFLIGNNARIGKVKKTIKEAELEADQIRAKAAQAAETKKKEAILEAKEEILAAKKESEREIKDRRAEVTRLERRVASREEQLDRKIEQCERKEAQLDNKIKENAARADELEAIKAQQLDKLQEISGLTVEEAKAEIIGQIEEEARYEAAMKLSEIEEQLKEDADDKARSILSLAISRLASDHVAEATVSVVALPNDDMKGRIIGREGRNIRTVETLTGVDLIIDDTPEAITVSCFDPVRREVARLALEKLIADGRIHPARIEEMVEKAKKEVELSIKQAGDRATFETGIHGISQELVKLLGRLRYRTSYGQNVLDHSIEVALLSGMIADEMGVDSTVAKRAGLLHDIGKALTHETEGSHVNIGVDVAKKYKESKEIIHAIEAHHGDVDPKSPIAFIVQAADAISAARPGARRENLENYIKRLQKLEEIAESFPGVEKSFAIQAGREVRIMVKPEMVSDQQMVLVARDVAKKIESELKYPGQIKINVVRESRATDYAK